MINIKKKEERIIRLDLERRVEELKLERSNIYFKMHCLYNAKTELYDRSLTDMRSRYDPTEAYITSDIKPYSDWNAKIVYDYCVKMIEKITKKSFDSRLWRDSVKGYYGLSAQGWIDLYEYMVKNGEYKGI